MWYSKIADVDFLLILLVISGIQPVYDRPRNGGKYSLIGIIFIIIHSVLCILSDRQSAEEEAILRHFVSGILFGMTTMGRVCSLLYPLMCVLGAIFQFGAVTTFLDLEDQMDLYFKRCNLNTLQLHRKIKKLQLISSVSAVVVSLISAYSGALYSQQFGNIGALHYYSAAFFSGNFILVVLRICNNYYALYLRMCLFCSHLRTLIHPSWTRF